MRRVGRATCCRWPCSFLKPCVFVGIRFRLWGWLQDPDVDEAALFVKMVDFQGLTMLHTAVIFHDLEAVCMLLGSCGLVCTDVKDRCDNFDMILSF